MGVMESESTQEESKGGFFSRLKKGLVKTRKNISGSLENLVQGRAKVGPELLQEIEEALLVSDAGLGTTSKIIEALESEVSENRIRESDEVMARLKAMMVEILEGPGKETDYSEHAPYVILVIGINGSGKTTTIGKLASHWNDGGHKVLLAAGDTFRAAAIDQLKTWADRTGVSIISQPHGADPSAVAFDAVQAAVSRKMDRVLVDTAGRLQTNANLMEELKKIKRVIGKVHEGAPHATWLVLDAGIGQNSISQAKLFHEALGVDGLIMTKLDGTSKGGVLLNITDTMGLPVKFIGVGEGADDLQPFNASEFVDALLSRDSEN
ncbi:MAG: signal recognition particle-docking protein FtsY [Candidatus Nitronauta litoralis]|uniref:Signal recognition particle receptor FtsY n=1 Tax=Candidatus Nitronauta litoralis TaxID=2705533 RepID=A0A7T0BT70_9BACT|nr:MAG: signal recognition particle-docking protein FtsY [Candidatus Nitronauta litoralis]